MPTCFGGFFVCLPQVSSLGLRTRDQSSLTPGLKHQFNMDYDITNNDLTGI